MGRDSRLGIFRTGAEMSNYFSQIRTGEIDKIIHIKISTYLRSHIHMKISAELYT